MKKLITLTFLFSLSAFAVEHVCTVNMVSRDNGLASRVFKGHSKEGLDRACNWARSFCQDAIDEAGQKESQFCLSKKEKSFGFDGRITPAIAYKRGEVRKTFGSVCYGKNYTEAKEFCREKVMTACGSFIRDTKEYGWYCSFK